MGGLDGPYLFSDEIIEGQSNDTSGRETIEIPEEIPESSMVDVIRSWCSFG